MEIEKELRAFGDRLRRLVQSRCLASELSDGGWVLTDSEGRVVEVIADPERLFASIEGLTAEAVAANGVVAALQDHVPREITVKPGAWGSEVSAYRTLGIPLADELGATAGCVGIWLSAANAEPWDMDSLAECLIALWAATMGGRGAEPERVLEPDPSSAGRPSTAREREMEQRLSELEELNRVMATRLKVNREIIDKDPEGLLFFDRDRRIVNMNREASEMLGVDRSASVGRSASEVMSLEPDLDWLLSHQQTLQAVRMRRADGEIDVVAHAMQLSSEEDRNRGYVLRLYDELFLRRMMNSRPQPGTRYTLYDLHGLDSRMVARIRRAADSDLNILITGETGTGKEVLAQSIHNLIAEQRRPFVAVNCAAIAPGLIESELFGYDAGSFTGASKSGHRGYFEQAHGGTLFLDEIAELSVDLQSKLLRAIQERKIRRVGGSESLPIKVRLICATNRFSTEVESRSRGFRADLFHRLNEIHFHLPSLRERPRLILKLVDHFSRLYRPTTGIRLSAKARRLLENHSWPGNIRELEKVIKVAMTMTDKELIGGNEIESLLESGDVEFVFQLREELSLEELKDRYIHYCLRYHSGNRQRTAEQLGIDRKTLYNRRR